MGVADRPPPNTLPLVVVRPINADVSFRTPPSITFVVLLIKTLPLVPIPAQTSDHTFFGRLRWSQRGRRGVQMYRPPPRVNRFFSIIAVVCRRCLHSNRRWTAPWTMAGQDLFLPHPDEQWATVSARHNLHNNEDHISSSYRGVGAFSKPIIIGWCTLAHRKPQKQLAALRAFLCQWLPSSAGGRQILPSRSSCPYSPKSSRSLWHRGS